MAVNPFDALGLPARPDLSDEQVRAAWRAIAAATHPDRRDGGDVARYTAATAAYAVLRTPWGRSEAFADLDPIPLAVDDTSPLPAVEAVDGDGPVASTGGGRASRPGDLLAAVLQLPTRIRHGLAAAAGHPRAGRRAAFAGRAEPDPRPARRSGAGHRADHLVPADRPLGPGTAAVGALNQAPTAGHTGAVSPSPCLPCRLGRIPWSLADC